MCVNGARRWENTFADVRAGLFATVKNVSKEAWKLWVEHMKMIMNEYRLNLGTREAQEFLIKQMEEYFFGEGAALPPDYVPPRAKG